MKKRQFAISALILADIIACLCIVWAMDNNPNDTAMVEIWTRHDLGYVIDTIPAVTWIGTGTGKYYIKSVDGKDYYSDKLPKEIRK